MSFSFVGLSERIAHARAAQSRAAHPGWVRGWKMGEFCGLDDLASPAEARFAKVGGVTRSLKAEW
jgi:hypothetical protein